MCVGVRRCTRVCAGVRRCVCVRGCAGEAMRGCAWVWEWAEGGLRGCAWVCAYVWDEFSEFLPENRVPTSADFNTYPIRIFKSIIQEKSFIAMRPVYFDMYHCTRYIVLF